MRGFFPKVFSDGHFLLSLCYIFSFFQDVFAFTFISQSALPLTDSFSKMRDPLGLGTLGSYYLGLFSNFSFYCQFLWAYENLENYLVIKSFSIFGSHILYLHLTV